MLMHELLTAIHVLGWVFWLGTDVGVFLAAKKSERRTDLSVESRLAVLELGMILDRAPRFAVPIVWMTGMWISASLGYPALPAPWVLVLGALWGALVWAGIFRPPGSWAQVWALRLQTAAYAAVILGMGSLGVIALAGAFALPAWLALKWLAFALVGVAAIWLERAFAPVVADYRRLAEAGSSAELESALRRHQRPVYVAVLAIYAATLIAGVSGITKFAL